jgi:hypothetical protein
MEEAKQKPLKFLDLKAVKDFAEYAQSKYVQANIIQQDDEL